MTRLLEQAIEQARLLSEDGQDALAAIILAELNDDQSWDERFAASSSQLARLAAKARKDVEDGRVISKGFDEL